MREELNRIQQGALDCHGRTTCDGCEGMAEFHICVMCTKCGGMTEVYLCYEHMSDPGPLMCLKHTCQKAGKWETSKEVEEFKPIPTDEETEIS